MFEKLFNKLLHEDEKELEEDVKKSVAEVKVRTKRRLNKA